MSDNPANPMYRSDFLEGLGRLSLGAVAADIYRAGGFGQLIYSEGEYDHFHSQQIDSFNGWRIGLPPPWYPTHSMAYYVGVTGKRLISVSCVGYNAAIASYALELTSL